MPTWNRRRTALAAGAAFLLVGTVATVLLVARHEPELDEDLLREIAPVVHADLPTNPNVTWQGTSDGRWFCAEQWIETRRDGGDVRVGVIASCSEYARRDDVLFESAGLRVPLVLTLTSGPGGWQVRGVQAAVDGAGHDASLRRMFSPAGYDEVRRSMNDAGPDPAEEAREAFGLPADTPVLPR